MSFYFLALISKRGIFLLWSMVPSHQTSYPTIPFYFYCLGHICPLVITVRHSAPDVMGVVGKNSLFFSFFPLLIADSIVILKCRKLGGVFPQGRAGDKRTVSSYIWLWKTLPLYDKLNIFPLQRNRASATELMWKIDVKYSLLFKLHVKACFFLHGRWARILVLS